MVIAADLVPWWFAAAFWLAFLLLVMVVIRDVRRAGGLRRVWDAVQDGIERRAAGEERDTHEPPEAVSDSRGEEPPRDR